MNRWTAATFDEFGRTLGIEGLAPGETGGLSLRLGHERRLGFQVAGDGAVVVLMAVPAGPGDTLSLKLRALSLCHARHGWALPMAAGLAREGDLVFLTRIPARQFVVSTVEQALDLLIRLHDQVRH